MFQSVAQGALTDSTPVFPPVPTPLLPAGTAKASADSPMTLAPSPVAMDTSASSDHAGSAATSPNPVESFSSRSHQPILVPDLDHPSTTIQPEVLHATAQAARPYHVSYDIDPLSKYSQTFTAIDSQAFYPVESASPRAILEPNTVAPSAVALSTDDHATPQLSSTPSSGQRPQTLDQSPSPFNFSTTPLANNPTLAKSYKNSLSSGMQHRSSLSLGSLPTFQHSSSFDFSDYFSAQSALTPTVDLEMIHSTTSEGSLAVLNPQGQGQGYQSTYTPSSESSGRSPLMNRAMDLSDGRGAGVVASDSMSPTLGGTETTYGSLPRSNMLAGMGRTVGGAGMYRLGASVANLALSPYTQANLSNQLTSAAMYPSTSAPAMLSLKHSSGEDDLQTLLQGGENEDGEPEDLVVSDEEEGSIGGDLEGDFERRNSGMVSGLKYNTRV